MSYREYMQSEHWRLLRGAKLQLSPRCERCKAKTDLEVHHVIYRANLCDGQLLDLQTLCHDCHMAEHAKAWPRKTPLLPVEKRIAAITRKIERLKRLKQTPRRIAKIARSQARLQKLAQTV